jgi:hypothetical protein
MIGVRGNGAAATYTNFDCPRIRLIFSLLLLLHFLSRSLRLVACCRSFMYLYIVIIYKYKCVLFNENMSNIDYVPSNFREIYEQCV